MSQTRDWIAFWNAPHSIYVNARHLDVHYRLIADEFADLIVAEAAVEGRSAAEAIILDYGCGEALHASLVAERVKRLILCDAAPNVRANLATRFANNPKIEVRSPEDVEALPDASLDVVAMISVTQYLDPALLDRLLVTFRRLLTPRGCVILADIVPPGVSPLADAAALLRLAWRNGFFGAALAGLIRTAFSDYRKLRTALGLTHYSEGEIVEKLARAGFAARRVPANIGHNQARMTFTATLS